MVSRGLDAAAVLMVAATVAINLGFLYGVVARPVIAYHLVPAIGYNETIDFSTDELRVDFMVDNRGQSGASIWLMVDFYNMTLTDPVGLDAPEDGYSSFRVPLEAPPLRSVSYSASFRSHGEFNYGVLILSIQANPETEVTARFSNSFAVFTPERPTAILLKNLGDGRFMRVSSR